MMISRNKSLFIVGGIVFTALIVLLSYSVYKALFAEEIKGRIMVVQRNAEVKRLALIKVHAISKKDAEDWRSAVINRYRRLVDERASFIFNSKAEKINLTNQNDLTISRLEKLHSASVECRDASREFWIIDPNQPSKKNHFFELIVLPGFPSAEVIEQDALSSRWDKCYEALRVSVVPELKVALDTALTRKSFELKRHDVEVGERLAQFNSEFSIILDPESLTEIPSVVKKIYSGFSDDNGDFSIRLPIGGYYLIARAQRRVFNADEHYFWAHPISVPSDESIRCLMGNNNMLSGPDKNLWTDLDELIKVQMEDK